MIRDLNKKTSNEAFGAVTALLACLALVFFMLGALPHHACAEDIDTNPEADALQLEVERTAAAYDEAVVQAEEAQTALEENRESIAELEEALPAQQARANAAARELYKFEKQRLGLLELVLSSESFYDFMANLDYMNRISKTNADEIARLNEMKAQLEEENKQLEEASAEADKRVREAEQALTAAQEARAEAQRKAAEAARQAAEADAAAAAAAGDESSVAQAAGEADSTVNDEADWTSDETAFVSSWASRIDDYLAGSPLSGYGRTFAQAAWDYGVDPRWSPAIAYTESSLGAYCFLPHNAWGWGSVSWGSWEEAINDHVRGLARGYGYTISMDAARKYCPPNADRWYSTTLAQMNMI